MGEARKRQKRERDRRTVLREAWEGQREGERHWEGLGRQRDGIEVVGEARKEQKRQRNR